MDVKDNKNRSWEIKTPHKLKGFPENAETHPNFCTS
jgi:hypothetical protein